MLIEFDSFAKGDPVLLSKYMRDNNISVDDYGSMDKHWMSEIAEHCNMKTANMSCVSLDVEQSSNSNK